MAEPTGGIDLFGFPPEIRRTIFDYVFEGRTFILIPNKKSKILESEALILPSSCGRNSDGLKSFEDSDGLEILRISEAVRVEASRSLHAEANFAFPIERMGFKHLRCGSLFNILDNVRNIELRFNVLYHCNLSSQDLTLRHVLNILNRLSAREGGRQQLVIVLNGLCGYSFAAENATWLEALKALQMHKSIILKIDGPVCQHTLRRVPWGASVWSCRPGHESLRNHFKRVLEPALGSSTFFENKNSIGITFQPSKRAPRSGSEDPE